jgi:hypothetical protein
MTRWAALALLVAAPAWAQDRPPASPTRDVDVLYRAIAAGQEVQQRYRFALSVEKVRIDTPSPGLYVIVDRGSQHMDMVSEGDRSVLELPYDPAHTMGGVAIDRSFERLGPDTIAGVPCTEWRGAEKAGRAMIVCMTDDGVLLRARTGANVLVQALRVSYAPLDPAVFAIPAGFERNSGRAR